MWKDFRFSARRSLTVILIIQVVAMVAAMYFALATITFLLFDASPATGAGFINALAKLGLTGTRISDLLYYSLLLLFVSTFIRGLISSSFGWLFTRVDESTIIASPAAPHALYLAKRFRKLLTHIMTVTLLLIAIYPVVTRIGFNGFHLIFLFITLLAFTEIYGLLENVTYSISRGLLKPRSRLQRAALIIAFLALVFFVVVPPFLVYFLGDPIMFIAYLYPPYLCSRILALNLPFGIGFGVSLLVIDAILFLIVASVTARFGLRRWSSSPRLSQTRGSFIRLRNNILMGKKGKKPGAGLIFMKDFWTTIRNPAKFFVPLAIAFLLFIFAFQLQLMFPVAPQPQLASQFTEPIFLLSTYLAAVFILPPAWDSFASERRSLFILKTAPIHPSEIVKGKYGFALLKSALYMVPIIGALSTLLPHSTDISLIALEVTLVVLVSNAVGLLSSVSYPPSYRGVGPPPFLIIIGLPVLCALLTAPIPFILMLPYSNVIQFVLQSGFMLLYVLFIVRICLGRATSSFVRLQET